MKSRREVPKYKQDGSRAKKDAVQYKCYVCNQWVSSTKIAVDHIVPVISVEEGFIDFNTFIERLFCGADNLGPICDSCHQKKTNAERAERNRKRDLQELEELRNRLPGMALRDAKKELKRYLSDKKHVDVRSLATFLMNEKTQVTDTSKP